MKGMRLTLVAFALTLAATTFAGRAYAGFDVPEIDPGSLASALALLTGGVFLVTDRCRTRR